MRTKRGNKNVAFIALNDGSCVANIQVVVDLSKFGEEELKPITTGACIRVDGRLVESLGSGAAGRGAGRESRCTARPTRPIPPEEGALAGVHCAKSPTCVREPIPSVPCCASATPWRMPSTVFQQAGLLLFPYAAHHGFRTARRGRHVPGDDPRPERCPQAR